MKKELKIALGILIGIVSLAIGGFMLKKFYSKLPKITRIKIAKDPENIQDEIDDRFEFNNDGQIIEKEFNKEEDMILIIVAIVGGVVIACASVGIYLVVRHFKKREIDEISKKSSRVGLDQISERLHIQIEELVEVYDEIQKYSEEIFEDILIIKNAERHLILANLSKEKEKTKKEMSLREKFMDFFESKGNLTKKSATGDYQDSEILKANSIKDSKNEVKIKARRLAIKERKKEVQKALENLEKLYNSCQDKIEFYEEKRNEFIVKDYIQRGEQKFVYKTKNYEEALIAAKELLDRARGLRGNYYDPQNSIQGLMNDQNALQIRNNMTNNVNNSNQNQQQQPQQNQKPSSEIVCGFEKVYEMGINRIREDFVKKYHGKKIDDLKPLFEELFRMEEEFGRNFELAMKVNFFREFSRVLNTDKPPIGYQRSRVILCSSEQIEGSKLYLNAPERLFSNPAQMRKTIRENRNASQGKSIEYNMSQSFLELEDIIEVTRVTPDQLPQDLRDKIKSNARLKPYVEFPDENSNLMNFNSLSSDYGSRIVEIT